MSRAGYTRVTRGDREKLLTGLIDAHNNPDGGGVLWSSLTARGRPTANKLISLGHARLDVSHPGGWLLKITDSGAKALLEGRP